MADAFRTGLEISGAKPSIISEQFVLVGNIKAPGDLHIEGTVRGDPEVASAIIGAGGLLEGSVGPGCVAGCGWRPAAPDHGPRLQT